MPSVKNLLISIDLQTGVVIYAGNTDTEAADGLFNTDGPISAAQRGLIDEIFTKLLSAIHDGKPTINLKVKNGTSTIVRDDSFQLPGADHRIVLALNAASADALAAALEVVRSVPATVPSSAAPKQHSREASRAATKRTGPKNGIPRGKQPAEAKKTKSSPKNATPRGKRPAKAKKNK